MTRLDPTGPRLGTHEVTKASLSARGGLRPSGVTDPTLARGRCRCTGAASRRWPNTAPRWGRSCCARPAATPNRHPPELRAFDAGGWRLDDGRLPPPPGNRADGRKHRRRLCRPALGRRAGRTMSPTCRDGLSGQPGGAGPLLPADHEPMPRCPCCRPIRGWPPHWQPKLTSRAHDPVGAAAGAQTKARLWAWR